MPDTNQVFLLGGYDLEMLTIKQMLEGRRGCVVVDKHLRWDNAKLSAYKEELKLLSNNDIFGIELQEDIPIPINYHRIDHHNDLNSKPSALEQVAQVVGVYLDRYQQLVAANDKGYITAMQQLSATKEEIDDIRRKDRTSQGVTDKDDSLAERSISENLERCGSLMIVESLTSRFSPICDRLFPYRHLLVYTDTEWMFYGEGKVDLVQMFADEISQKKMFYGGGDDGYIGAVSKVYSKEEINQYVKLIREKYGCI